MQIISLSTIALCVTSSLALAVSPKGLTNVSAVFNPQIDAQPLLQPRRLCAPINCKKACKHYNQNCWDYCNMNPDVSVSFGMGFKN
jgi:hypothetical protein